MGETTVPVRPTCWEGGVPAEVAGGAAGADRRTEHAGQLLEVAEGFGAAQAAAAGDDDLGVFEAHAFGFGGVFTGDAGAQIGIAGGDIDDLGAARGVGLERVLRLGADGDHLRVGLDSDDLTGVAAVAGAGDAHAVALDFEGECVHRGGAAQPGGKARGEVAPHAALGEEDHPGRVLLDDLLRERQVGVGLVLRERGVGGAVDGVGAGRAGRLGGGGLRAEQGEGDIAAELGGQAVGRAEQLAGGGGQRAGFGFADDEDGGHVALRGWSRGFWRCAGRRRGRRPFLRGCRPR